ncbi:MAG: glycine cleavage system protein GcvH [Chloroflexi bacterium]|nr:glycine cleavage system protein GcvH [Chloroflexota bacterium]
MKFPEDLKYAKSDEWVRIDGDVATIGISDYAQDALNDIVFVDYIVGKGDTVSAGAEIANVESVKAASEIYSFVSGTVTETNAALVDSPETINADPYGEAWLVKIKVDGTPDLSALMDAAAYAKYCEDR